MRKLQFPVEIFKSKPFSTDEYLLWDSDGVFCKGVISVQAEIKEIFGIWSTVDLYQLNCQYFKIPNEIAQSSIYKYLSIKLTTVNYSSVSNCKHSHGILVHFENRCWTISIMGLIAGDGMI